MKKIFLVSSLLALTACMLCGCDMFRSLAGRPTSGDLAEMRAELARREAVETARRDSVERVFRHQQDSIAAAEKALETLAGLGGLVRDPSQLSGLSSHTSLGSRYYAVLGSFKDHSNAVKFMDRIVASGYPAELITFKSGLTSVGACCTDDPAQFLQSLDKIKTESFCPSDFWILVNG